MMRACTKCGEVKPLEEYHTDRNASAGKSRRCKECAKLKARQWNAENRERKKQTRSAYYDSEENRRKKAQADAAYRLANREARRESHRRYAAKNSPRIVERVRLWRVENAAIVPAKRRHEAATRRARIKKACPPWADMEKIAEVYALADRLTRETGVPHDVDHVIPLQGRTVSGLHIHTNLRAIPASENRRKSRKVVAELLEQVCAEHLQQLRRGYRLSIGGK